MRFSGIALYTVKALIVSSTIQDVFAEANQISGRRTTTQNTMDYIQEKMDYDTKTNDDFKDIGDEDAKYWARFVTEVESMSMAPPTSPPTLPPTPVPTPYPGCTVDVEIECVTADGVPCDQIPPTDGQCSEGLNPLTGLKFQYKFCACEESDNSQEDDGTFKCIDESGIDKCEAANQVDIECVGSDNENYFNGQVPNNDFFSVNAMANGVLPETITCLISVTEGDQVFACQEVEFDTSGKIDLVLTDKFGSIGLTSCTDDEGNTEDCYEDITYTYVLENVGDIYMDITKVLRTDNEGNTQDLISLVPPDSNPLEVGENITIEESLSVYVCNDTCYEVSVYVEADPPGDIFCNDTDDYKFYTNFSEPCDVEVNLECVTADGKECQAINPPENTQCALAPETITKLAFEYSLEGCDSGANDQDNFQCNDDTSCVREEEDEVVITCLETGSGLEISSSSVSVGDMFVLSSPSNLSPLPSSVRCTVTTGATGAGCESQSFVFDPSGEEDLKLNDYFGSLKVKSCDDDSGVITTCLEEVTYTYTVVNDGSTNLEITEWTRFCNGEAKSLYDLLTDEEKIVTVDQSVSKMETDFVDSCTPQCIEKSTVVKAISTDGSVCEHNEELSYCLETPPPTPSPTSPPTLPPTPAPTPSPTLPPTLPPTPAPTPSPTLPPTLPPTPVPTPYPGCTVDVEVDCVTADGVPCEDIPATNGQCKPDLSPLTELEFQYQFRFCNESMNSQSTDGFYSCEDFEDIEQCRNGEGLMIKCEGSDDVVYFDGTVGPEDFIPIIAEGNSTLSTLMTCQINKVLGGFFACQEVTFDTSGTEDLTLTDSFGSISLASCADRAGNMADCFLDVIYTYTLTNVGEIEMNITEAIRTYNYDNPENLIGLFPEEKNPLEVGDSVDITESRTINICNDTCYDVEIYFEADPPGDVNCNDTDFFKFNVTYEKPCDVQVDIECKLDDDPTGMGCYGISVPCFECSPKDISDLTFTFEEQGCLDSENNQVEDFQCEDSPCSEEGNFRVLCESEGTVFCNCTAVEGGLIVISSQIILPESLTCTVYSEDSNQKCQEFSFNPSGTSELNLKDSFGSLVVDTCGDTEGNENTCIIHGEFIYTIANSGSSDFELAVLNRTCNGEGKDLLDGGGIPPNAVIPSGLKAAVKEEGARIDACAGYLDKRVYIEGLGLSDGKPCFDEDTLVIDFMSKAPSLVPTPAPEPCNVTLDSVCAPPQESWLPDNQTDCALPPLQDLCSERPSQMVMRYNGGPCGQSDNMQPDKSGCTDFPNSDPEIIAGPPTAKGTTSWIEVFAVKDPSTIYFSGFVDVSDEFELNDGSEEVEADMGVKIYEPNAANDGPGALLQDQFFHSSCSQNLFLKDRFGSVQLVAWLNGIQGFVTCFVEVVFTFGIVNQDLAGDALLKTLFTLTNLGGDGKELLNVNLTDQVYNKVLGGGDEIEITQSFIIDATVRRFYTAVTRLTGINEETGGKCDYTDTLSFTAGADLTPVFPTKAPTLNPTTTEFPTIDPNSEDAECSIRTKIDCAFDGKSCTALELPTVTCLEELPNSVEFMYTGTSCMEDSSPALKDCTNNNAIPDGTASVRVKVGDDKLKEPLFFDSVVSLNELFNVNTQGEKKLGIEIYSIAGVLLQEITTDTKCESDKKQFTTGDNFGALMLTGFDNTGNGGTQIVNGEETLDIIYSVSSDSRYITTLNDGSAIGRFDNQTFIDSTSTVLLQNYAEEYELGTFSLDINLFTMVNEKMRFGTNVEGYITANPSSTCNASSVISVEISG